MDSWTINEADGTVHSFTGNREQVVAYFTQKYPNHEVEAFTDQVLVYDAEVYGGDTIDCDPVASAVPE